MRFATETRLEIGSPSSSFDALVGATGALNDRRELAGRGFLRGLPLGGRGLGFSGGRSASNFIEHDKQSFNERDTDFAHANALEPIGTPLGGTRSSQS